MRKYGLVLLLTAVAAGQTAGKPAAPAMRTYSDGALQLTFSYPAELTPVSAKAAVALGQRILYGEDGASDEKTIKAGAACTRTLLAVGEDSPVMAQVSLFAIDMSCVPQKAAKNHKLMDQVLNGMAAQGNEVLGVSPMESPVGFLLGGHHAFFAAAQGTPVTDSALQTSQGQVTATIATAVDGKDGVPKILVWHVVSSDTAVFNRLLASPVAIGAGPAQPLFPAQVR